MKLKEIKNKKEYHALQVDQALNELNQKKQNLNALR